MADRPTQLLAPTLDEQITCVEREIAMRERVYPAWVRNGRMTQQKADREVETMRAVASTLHRVNADLAAVKGRF